MALKATRKKLTAPEVMLALRQFKNALQKERVPLRKMILFGSYAKGLAHGDSDIDVAVVLPSGLNLKERRSADNIPWLAKQIQIKLEPHVMTTRDLDNPYLALVKEIKQYGQKI